LHALWDWRFPIYKTGKPTQQTRRKRGMNTNTAEVSEPAKAARGPSLNRRLSVKTLKILADLFKGNPNRHTAAQISEKSGASQRTVRDLLLLHARRSDLLEKVLADQLSVIKAILEMRADPSRWQLKPRNRLSGANGRTNLKADRGGETKMARIKLLTSDSETSWVYEMPSAVWKAVETLLAAAKIQPRYESDDTCSRGRS
jgi:hypothetical protein